MTHGKMFEITRHGRFSAAHRLELQDEKHKCFRPHGHNYEVAVTLASNVVDSKGMVLDFGLVDKLLNEIYDHRDLNEVLEEEPTSENLALDIFDKLYHSVLKHLNDGEPTDKHVVIVKVSVKETADSEVVFYPPKQSRG